MTVRTLTAAAILLCAFPAVGQGGPESTSATGGLSAPEASTARAARPGHNIKVICKVTTETGSRLMGHKICLPEAEWTEQAERARESVENADRHTH